MRVAVTLPHLPPTSLARSAILATLQALRAEGIRFEGFCEEPRTYDEIGFDVYHYLRASERHRVEPFSTGLYPLGRDWRPYEASLLLMQRFPAVVWALDPVLHHLLVGGVAMCGWWDEYRSLVEEAFGAQKGAALAMTVASGWAVRSTYREADPTSAVLRSQRSVCAATRAIAASINREGSEVPIVPLTLAQEPGADVLLRPGEGGVRRILVVAFHYGWPDPLLGAVAELLDRFPDLQFGLVVPELVRQVLVQPRAAMRGIADRVEWLEPEDDRLEREVRNTDLVVHLRDDPTASERVLIDAGLAAGKPAILLRAPLAHDLPDDAAILVEPGRSFATSLTEWIGTLVEDEELYRAMCAAAARSFTERPGPAMAARSLRSVLQRARGHGLQEHRLSGGAWSAVGRSARLAAIPVGASEEQRALLESLILEAVPERLRGRFEQNRPVG